jgi:hypothetical protein
MIYRRHPFEKELRYIGVDIFHATLLDELQSVAFLSFSPLASSLPCYVLLGMSSLSSSALSVPKLSPGMVTPP